MPEHEPRNDRELLDAWAAKDEKAGSLLVERHFDLVYRFFRHRVGAAAGDLVQRTFLACLESRARLNDVVNFRAFLLGIAYNLLLRHLRSEGTRRELPGEPDDSDPDTFSLGGALVLLEQQKLLLRALRRLSVDLQLTLELYYWEELPTAEIATILGIPRGTVLNRLFRARHLLKHHIDELAADAELAQTTARGLETWARSLRERLRGMNEKSEG